jgi:hypothetical protein
VDLSTSILTELQERVLRALADPDTPPLGSAIARTAGIAQASGVYVVLRRLEDFGLAREQWSPTPVRDAAGKGHRRIYTLTPEGAAFLASR